MNYVYVVCVYDYMNVPVYRFRYTVYSHAVLAAERYERKGYVVEKIKFYSE